MPLMLNPIPSLRSQRDANPCCHECARRGTKCDEHSDVQTNPTPGTIALLIGGAALGLSAGYVIYKRRNAVSGQKLPPDVALEGILVPGEILAAAPSVIADVMQPIMLADTAAMPGEGYSRVEELIVKAPGTLHPDPIEMRDVAFGVAFGNQANDLAWTGTDDSGNAVEGIAPPDTSKAIGALVTNVAGDVAATIYEVSLGLIDKYRTDYDDGGVRDAITMEVLAFVAPSVDYTNGLKPYAFGDAASRFWIAAQLIGTVAWQSWGNKRAAAALNMSPLMGTKVK